ncbi:MAG TPA: IS200/IS605 family transposase [Isosphaeraceae bacterium]|nr:IS200/IS605 family transposase [Isosphaeraceae bacterium]
MATTFTNLLYHIVFSTKLRHPLITPALRTDLYAYLGGIIRGHGGTLVKVGGMPDHIHLVIQSQADIAVSDMLRQIKGSSSKWINNRRDSTTRFGWQTGYGAFSVSASQLESVVEYVEKQEEHHRKMTFQEELIKLLERHGIEYDERYLWD